MLLLPQLTGAKHGGSVAAEQDVAAGLHASSAPLCALHLHTVPAAAPS